MLAVPTKHHHHLEDLHLQATNDDEDMLMLKLDDKVNVAVSKRYRQRSSQFLLLYNEQRRDHVQRLNVDVDDRITMSFTKVK